jgi:chloramphenicol 3-O-phosphotransferase
MSGQVIIVSGTSGAGKSTTCAAFAKRSAEPYLMFGMDLLVGTLFPPQYTIFGAKRAEGYGGNTFGAAMGWPAVKAMHAMIAAAARSGQNMIVDHLMFVDPPILQDCIWAMRDVPVLFVNLQPPKEILARRVTEREVVLPAPMVEAAGGMDGVVRLGAELAALVPWFYDHAYQNDCYDLTIDSSQLTPDGVCALIERRLHAGPAIAFAELRKRYPAPGAVAS